MDIAQLIKQPELLDRETLYDLRSLLALYPYYQTARLLLLQTSTCCMILPSTRNCGEPPSTLPTVR